MWLKRRTLETQNLPVQTVCTARSKTLVTSMKREEILSDLTLPHHLVFQTSPIPIPTILIAAFERQYIVGEKLKKLDVVYFVWIMWKKIKNIFACRFSYLSKV